MKRFWAAATVLASAFACAGPAAAQVSIGISVRVAPPPLPVYAQPPLPGPDYIWTPGYWAWDDLSESYFWVPGTWVLAPRPGYLWTPPWWGWSDGVYVFHPGYWGPHVGFYGGVPYGFGYTGFGYQGGYWRGGHVFYNKTVTNITHVTNVTNIYQRNVVVNNVTRVSYNGGPGGVQARASAQELAAVHEAHLAPTGNQQAHMLAAWHSPAAFASSNHGHPALAATAHPLDASRFAVPPGAGRTFHPEAAPMQTSRFDRPFRAAPQPFHEGSFARVPQPPHGAPPQQHWGPPPPPHYAAAPRVAYHPALGGEHPHPHPEPHQDHHAHHG